MIKPALVLLRQPRRPGRPIRVLCTVRQPQALGLCHWQWSRLGEHARVTGTGGPRESHPMSQKAGVGPGSESESESESAAQWVVSESPGSLSLSVPLAGAGPRPPQGHWHTARARARAHVCVCECDSNLPLHRDQPPQPRSCSAGVARHARRLDGPRFFVQVLQALEALLRKYRAMSRRARCSAIDLRALL